MSGEEPVRWEATLTLDGARLVVDGAIAAALRLGVAVAIAVADRAGEVVAFARMDRAPLLSSRIAEDKAWTVCAFNGLPTHAWWPLLENEPALLHGITKTPRLIVFGGGVPIVVGGVVAGAVGVSGGTAEQDRAIAEAGAAALS
jgi:glc operon protein GlcG